MKKLLLSCFAIMLSVCCAAAPWFAAKFPAKLVNARGKAVATASALNGKMVAVYFSAFPAEAQKYIRELEEYWEEEEQREQETEERLAAYVRKMKKGEAQEALLQLLFDGPEWQYDRFVEEHLGEW